MLSTNDKAVWTRRRARGAGFSLIELLVVIAITLVLLTLLFGPLITGFNLTARAQATTAAQDSARIAMEQISRELQSAASVRDTSHQYLNLLMYKSASAGVSETVAHAYDSYIDIIPPRQNSSGSFYDPTLTGGAGSSGSGAVTIKPTNSGNTVLTPSEVQLPVAPGTTIVRYFVGLRHPFNLDYTPGGAVGVEEEPYVNYNEGQTIPASDTNDYSTYVVGHALNNPYILYRAEVQPYMASTSGSPVTYSPNSNFFDTKNSAPVLDDPDFFRIINPSDSTTSLDNPQGLTTAQITAHNTRVYHWYQIARPIINLSDINLIFQPHDGSGNVVYDATTGYPSGTQTDTDGTTPILRTSVSFAPATIAGDPMHPSTNADVSQGYGSAPEDATLSSYNSTTTSTNTQTTPYIPTLYKASTGEWQGGANLTITGADGSSYVTYVAGKASTITSPPATISVGDVIERCIDGPSSGGTTSPVGTDVYDVTNQTPLTTSTNFAAFNIDNDSGTINFAVPDVPISGSTSVGSNNIASSFPGGATGTTATYNIGGDASTNTSTSASNSLNPYWFITYGQGYTPTVSNWNPSGALDIYLKKTGNPTVDSANEVLLPNTHATEYMNYGGISRIAVNSERVYGPEQEPGPAIDTNQWMSASSLTTPPSSFPLVPYHRVPLNIGAIGAIGYDQYMIDYNNGIIYLGTTPKNINTSATSPVSRTVLVAFSSQNNLTAANSTTLAPDTVVASYQTGSRIAVSIGLRVFDPSNKQPTYFSLTNNVAVGNSTQ